jgi:DNA polymerase-1
MKLVTSIEQTTREERLSWLGQPYSIDVETTGLEYTHDDLIGVALHVNNEQYYFVRKHTLDDGVTVKDYLSDTELHYLLNPIMSQQHEVSSLHNSKFDLHFFERFGLPLSSRNFDTLIAAKLLNENRQNGLKQLTYLVGEDHSAYETLVEYSTFPKGCPLNVPLEPFAKYAAMDVLVTFKLWQLFRKELAKDTFRGISMQDVFNEIWMPMIPVLREMEERGWRLDLVKTQELYDKYAARIEICKEEVQRKGMQSIVDRFANGDPLPKYHWQIIRDEEVYINDEGVPCVEQYGIETPCWLPNKRSKMRRMEFKVSSPKQMVEFVLETTEIPAHVELVKTKGGNDSANVGNLKTIQYYMGDKAPPYLDALLEWRKIDKFVNTYLRMFLDKTDENAMLHGYFNMAAADYGGGGTTTGRLSSSRPNFQQIPSRDEIGREARSLFLAREGYQLVVADYSNMETVIAAHYSKDQVLMKAFSEGLDVHALTACAQHNIPYDQFMEQYNAKDPHYDAMRRTAKTLLFGQAYGMGANKLQRELLIQNSQEFTVDETRAMLESFRETYWGLTEWKKQVILAVRKYGYVATILGRKRRLPLSRSSDREISSRAERQGVNAIIQGSCADILFQAMVPIQAAFKGLGGSLIASVHDELVGEVPSDYAEVAAHIMQTLMVGLINPKLDCKLKAEAHYGSTWLEAKG